MKGCDHCGSYAINPRDHGRVFGVDAGLCDVCYWRKRAARRLVLLQAVLKVAPGELGSRDAGCVSRTFANVNAEVLRTETERNE
jgi:hypothetical protein